MKFLKSAGLLAFILTLSACGGPKNIKLTPQNSPNNQKVYLIATKNFRHFIKFATGLFVSSAKAKKILPVFTKITPNAYTEKYAKRILKKFGVKYQLTSSSNLQATYLPYRMKSEFPQSDRDLSAVKKNTDAELVLEFRIIKFQLIQNRGLGGDYNVVIKIQGILHDLKSGNKIWQSTTSSKNEIDGYSYKEMIANNGKAIKIYMKKAVRIIIRKLISELRK